MQIFHNRILAICCCLYVACSVLFSSAHQAFAETALILSSFLFASLAILCAKKPSKMLLIALLCCFFSFLSILATCLYFHVKLPFYQSYIDKETVMEGTVIERRTSLAYASSFTIQLSKIDGQSVQTDIKLECTYASALQPGDLITVRATGRDFRMQDSFDEKAATISEGIAGIFVCDDPNDCEISEASSKNLRVLFSKWNGNLDFRLNQAVKGKEGKLVSALLLGNRDELEGDTALAFRRTGISHLLALSGMHISILIAFVERILQKFHIQKPYRMGTVIVLSILYLFLTGCAPSTVRAVLMMLILYLSYFCGEEYDGFTALCFALFLILFASPYSVADLGMYMSFIAAGSIVIFMPALQRWSDHLYDRWRLPKIFFRLTVAFVTALFVGLVANFAMALIQAFVFGEFSLLSVPMTMLLSIPMTLTLTLGIGCLLCPFLFALPCRLCAGLMLYLSDHASNLSDILIPVNDLLSGTFLALVTLSMVLLAGLKIKRKRWIALPPLFLILAILSSYTVSFLPNDRVRVDYVLESGGDLLLLSNQTHAVAIDFSDGTAGGATTLLAVAKEARCTELDDLILTHYHNRDTYLIASFAKQIKVRRLRLPLPQSEWEEAVAKRLEEEAAIHNIQVSYHLDGLSIPNLEICESTHALFPSERHTALLLSISANGRELTYVNASVPDSNLSEQAEHYMRKSEILIFGKTGYASSSTKKFPYLLHSPEAVILADERLEEMLQNISDSVLIRVHNIYTCYL